MTVGGFSTTSSVMALFDNEERPLSPSQIDRKLGLPDGMAHDVITNAWADGWRGRWTSWNERLNDMLTMRDARILR